MKLNQVLMAGGVVALCVASATAQANTVTFNGSIIDAACSISPESVDQSVDLGQVANAALKNGGQSTPKQFSIKLEDCVLDDKTGVAVTFDGVEGEASGSLALTGMAKGADIMLADQSGTQVQLGKASKLQNLTDGANKVIFNAYLQGQPEVTAETGDYPTIVPGDFSSVTTFTLSYQ